MDFSTEKQDEFNSYKTRIWNLNIERVSKLQLSKSYDFDVCIPPNIAEKVNIDCSFYFKGKVQGSSTQLFFELSDYHKNKLDKSKINELKNYVYKNIISQTDKLLMNCLQDKNWNDIKNYIDLFMPAIDDINSEKEKNIIKSISNDDPKIKKIINSYFKTPSEDIGEYLSSHEIISAEAEDYIKKLEQRSNNMENKSFTPEQIKYREDFQKISKIADKIIMLSKEYNLPEREKFNIMMDFDNVNKVCPLDLNMLLEKEHEKTLLHDYAGIYSNFDRTSLKLKNEFVPRSAYSYAELKLYKLIDSFFNSKKSYFSKNECLVFAKEIACEDFGYGVSYDKDNKKLLFWNPYVESVDAKDHSQWKKHPQWSFENTPSGRLSFVKDLIDTSKALNHENYNLSLLENVSERLNDEIKTKQKSKNDEYDRSR